MDNYLTKKEVKEYTTLSYKINNNAIRFNKLKSVFIGNRHLFKRDWVDSWLEGKGVK